MKNSLLMSHISFVTVSLVSPKFSCNCEQEFDWRRYPTVIKEGIELDASILNVWVAERQRIHADFLDIQNNGRY